MSSVLCALAEGCGVLLSAGELGMQLCTDTGGKRTVPRLLSEVLFEY